MARSPDGKKLDQLDFRDCGHVIDNGLGVKFGVLRLFIAYQA
jgi:hypothetical protein